MTKQHGDKIPLFSRAEGTNITNKSTKMVIDLCIAVLGLLILQRSKLTCSGINLE